MVCISGSAAATARAWWWSLPETVTAAVEREVGHAVIGATDKPRGRHGGLIGHVTFADGQVLFVKAAHDRKHPIAFARYYAQQQVMGHLPISLPTPKLRWHVQISGWVILAFENSVLAGAESSLAGGLELTHAGQALWEISEWLTPAPAALQGLPTTRDLDTHLSFWREAADGGYDAEAIPDTMGIDPWVLAELEGMWAELAQGATVNRFSLDGGDIQVSEVGDILVCGWSLPVLAAPWLDTVLLLLDAWAEVDAEAILASHPLAQGVNPRAVDAVLAALSGLYARWSAAPPEHCSDSVLERYHLRQEAALEWLQQRLLCREVQAAPAHQSSGENAGPYVDAGWLGRAYRTDTGPHRWRRRRTRNTRPTTRRPR